MTTPQNTPSALRISDLAVRYPASRGGLGPAAVDGVSLEVARGEAVALVGASGSGKSTIARTLFGLLPERTAVSGTLEVGGTDLSRLERRARRALLGDRVTLVPQDPLSALDPVRRIGDQVGEPLRIRGRGSKAEISEATDRALTEAGLTDLARIRRAYPHELSGGQRQRVLIATALITGPELIVADEPTSALDVTVQRVILDRLQLLVREHGIALLLITHDLALAAERTDRAIVLNQGRIAEEGPSRRVLASPRAEYTRRLVAALPSLRPIARRPAPDHRGENEPATEPIGEVGPATEPVGERPPAVTVAHAFKTFRSGGVQATRDVSVSIPAGGALGIVGESGSGKSTLARIILGLETADHGEITVSGHTLRTAETTSRSRRGELKRLWRAVQPVFQDPYASFDPTRKVGDSVAEPLRGFGIGAKRDRAATVTSLLEDVGLDPSLASRRPRELSGGQLQRAAIARALAASPEILVCDEPVSALDVLVQDRILRLLERLRDERGLTLVFISHDLSVVRSLCEEVAVMRDGEVVEAGATARVFEAPRTDYTRELLAAVPGVPTAA